MTPFLIFGLALAAQAPPVPAPAGDAGSLFAVTLRVGPAWVTEKAPREQSFFREHSENIRRLRAEGQLVVGGRFSDVGLLLVRARSVEEARALIERDPAIKAGVFQYEAHPWQTFAGGCLETPAPPSSPAPTPTR